VFENRMMKIFVSKRGMWWEAGGDCMMIVVTSPNIIKIKSKRIRWTEHVTAMDMMTIEFLSEILKRPLQRHRRITEDNTE
jgi:hypothetical protein